MLKSIKSYLDQPAYVFAAGLIGAAATYVLYSPLSSKAAAKIKNTFLKSGDCPRGLTNDGNDCYMNVILQSLAASNKVNEWLLKFKCQINNNNNNHSVDAKQQQSSTSSNTFILVETLTNILMKINRRRSNADDVYVADDNRDDNSNSSEFDAAVELKKALSAHRWRIRSEEHDCHELFHVIMDALEEEEKEYKNSISSLNYFAATASSSSTASKSHAQLRSQQQQQQQQQSSSTNSKNPFLGYMASQLECLTCGYKYPLRLESFYSLSLAIPSKVEVSLIDCINNFFRTEFISDMKCEKCSQTTKQKGFIKRQAIAKLPDCLCVQLQRNSWSGNSLDLIKQTKYVQFPLKIKIDDSSSSSSSSSDFTNSSFLSASSNATNTNNTFSLRQIGLGGILLGRRKKQQQKLLLNSAAMANLNVNETNEEATTSTAAAATENSTTTNSNLSSSSSSSKTSLGSNQEANNNATTATTDSYYELRSAIVHYGSAHSGHFISYRRTLTDLDSSSSLSKKSSNTNDNNRSSLLKKHDGNAGSSSWLKISDNDIRLCRKNDLLASNVYMLFYDKLQNQNNASPLSR